MRAVETMEGIWVVQGVHLQTDTEIFNVCCIENVFFSFSLDLCFSATRFYLLFITIIILSSSSFACFPSFFFHHHHHLYPSSSCSLFPFLVLSPLLHPSTFLFSSLHHCTAPSSHPICPESHDHTFELQKGPHIGLAAIGYSLLCGFHLVQSSKSKSHGGGGEIRQHLACSRKITDSELIIADRKGAKNCGPCSITR